MRAKRPAHPSSSGAATIKRPSLGAAWPGMGLTFECRSVKSRSISCDDAHARQMKCCTSITRPSYSSQVT